MSTPRHARLKRIVERTDTHAGRAFDMAIQLLIVSSLVTFAIETLPDLSPSARITPRLIETVTVLVFTAEYVLRILVADRPLRFIFSFFGLVDLIAILPFYIATGLDLRSVRALRLLRLFRIIKLVRYSEALSRFRRAFLLVREELVIFLSASAVIVYLASVGIYDFENPAQPEIFASVFHSMWWAIATLTTVGYGDIYPITAGGRIFTGVVLLAGLGIVAVPAGVLASALSQIRTEDLEGRGMRLGLRTRA